MMENRLFLLFLGVIATLVLGWVLDIHSEISQWMQANEFNQQLNQQIIISNQLQNQKDQLVKDYSKLMDEIQQKSGLIGNADLPEVLLRLFPEAELSGIKVSAIKPYPVRKIWNKTGRFIEITATGSLKQFNTFFEVLARVSLPFLFSYLNMYREQDHWRAQIYFIYFLNETISQNNHHQIMPNDLSVGSNVLQLFPVAQLSYVGMIANLSMKWALIQLPNERTLSVGLGEKIGSEKAAVISITSQKVMLKTDAKQSFTIMRAKEK